MNIDEREWQAQEQALRDSRADAMVDARRTGYRHVADALRVATPPRLPTEFAADVAARAMRSRVVKIDSRLEDLLTALMAVLLVLAGLVSAFAYGRDWVAPLLTLLPEAPSMPLRLGATLAACAGLSWAIDGVLKRRARG